MLKAVNTIGCGDSLTAGIAYALTTGQGLEDAIRVGQNCAAQNAQCLRPGVIR